LKIAKDCKTKDQKDSSNCKKMNAAMKALEVHVENKEKNVKADK
jgi:hypothetical protein